jgi:hypothetical protein
VTLHNGSIGMALREMQEAKIERPSALKPNYFAALRDYEDKKSEGPGLTRYYDSSSSKVGAFGKGWCIRYEDKLVRLPEGRLLLIVCSKERIFSPTYYSSALDAVTNVIVEKYKERAKASDTETEALLRAIRATAKTRRHTKVESARDL